MNANELADKLSQYGEGAVFANIKLTDVATMLRQQQSEIEALKGEVAHLKHINKNWSISEGWALKEIEALKAKTLTGAVGSLSDEEKDEIIAEFMGEYYKGDIVLHQMISAILRKAQEK
jgi:hypothetical protein